MPAEDKKKKLQQGAKKNIKKRPKLKKKLALAFSIKKVEDGIAVTRSSVPAGLGKLVYFLDPYQIPTKIFPGIVMASDKKSTVIFALAQNYLLTTDLLVTILRSHNGSLRTDFVIDVQISKLLGQSLDIFGNGSFSKKNSFKKLLPKPQNGIAKRVSVWRPLITGIKVIDCLFPIGLGQRQLIIGDRYTGKTTIAVDTILSQRKTKMKCIFVSIAQKQSAVNKLISIFKKEQAFHYTTLISANASDPVALQFLAPYTGCSLAEIFSTLGGDSLIVYDDLSKHSVAYRQMALLLRKSPGRDAFPSDIFYLHSTLLERAGQYFSGSLTALPVIETLGRDVSAFIPTNIISITDGQIFLDSGYFNRGILPAVNVSLSVSRVGSKSQYPCLGYMSKWVKMKITEFRGLESLLSFADDVDNLTALKLKFGLRLSEFLCQMKSEVCSCYDQLLLFALVFKGALKFIAANKVSMFVDFFVSWTNEFLLRYKGLGLKQYYVSFNQIWYFNFGDKKFMERRGFVNFYCYIMNLFIRGLSR